MRKAANRHIGGNNLENIEKHKDYIELSLNFLCFLKLWSGLLLSGLAPWNGNRRNSSAGSLWFTPSPAQAHRRAHLRAGYPGSLPKSGSTLSWIGKMTIQRFSSAIEDLAEAGRMVLRPTRIKVKLVLSWYCRHSGVFKIHVGKMAAKGRAWIFNFRAAIA